MNNLTKITLINLSHNPEAERIRKAHLWAETNLHIIGGVLGFVGVFLSTFFIDGGLRVITGRTIHGWELFLFLIGIALALVGAWLYCLKPIARWPASALALLILKFFPWGTVMGLYVLCSVHCKRGRTILSAEYQEIRKATPDIKTPSASILLYAIAIILFAVASMGTWMKLFSDRPSP